MGTIQTPKYDNETVTLGYLKKILKETQSNEPTSESTQVQKNYSSQPTPPYYVDSLLLLDGQIYRCKKSRLQGSFDISDWVLVVDEKPYENFITNVYPKDKEDLQEQIDNKVESYVSETDPSLEWTTDLEKEKHVGDYWRKQEGNTYKTYTYTKYFENPVRYSWVEADVPSSVYDLIDSKKTIFSSIPSKYNKDDLWLIEEGLSEDLLPNGCTYGDWVLATTNSDTYDKTHWTKSNGNVDLSQIEEKFYTKEIADQKNEELWRETTTEIEKSKNEIELKASQTYAKQETVTEVINEQTKQGNSISENTKKIGEIETTTTTLSETVSSLKIGVGEISSKVSETEKTVEEQNVNINDLNNSINDVVNDLNTTNQNLNNNYSTKNEVNELLESQKNEMQKEYTTLVTQTKTQVETSIIEKITTNGVTTLKNTLVTINGKGIMVATNQDLLNTLITNKSFTIKNGNFSLVEITPDGSKLKNTKLEGRTNFDDLMLYEKTIHPTFGIGLAHYHLGVE